MLDEDIGSCSPRTRLAISDSYVGRNEDRSQYIVGLAGRSQNGHCRLHRLRRQQRLGLVEQTDFADSLVLVTGAEETLDSSNSVVAN